MAPQVGLEPTTDRLTADSSTTELLRNNFFQQGDYLIDSLHYNDDTIESQHSFEESFFKKFLPYPKVISFTFVNFPLHFPHTYLLVSMLLFRLYNC